MLKDRIVSTMIGCVVSLLILLASMGAVFTTDGAVSKQIALESPYTKDRSLILYRLEQIEKKLDTLLQK
jgi:hypothetical protein